jgi:hypothetical protein
MVNIELDLDGRYRTHTRSSFRNDATVTDVKKPRTEVGLTFRLNVVVQTGN